MTDRKQFNIKIKSEKAEKWENEAKNNSQYSSMTDLIRQSVEKELADSNDSGSPSQGGMGKDIAEIKDMFRQNQQQITSLTHTVSDLKDEIEGRGPPDKHLRSEIFAALPPRDLNNPKTPGEIADIVGGPVDKHMVLDILEDMSEEMGVVKERIGKDAVLYEKED